MQARPKSPELPVPLGALGLRIRELRERRGITQEDFASRCGISVSFASLLERGARRPSYETLLQVARALETPVPELFRHPVELADEPSAFRLLEFARARRLNRSQVDRMLAVAAAMFDPPAERAPETPPSGPTCTQPGCRRPLLAKGLCASHYHRARRAKP